MPIVLESTDAGEVGEFGSNIGKGGRLTTRREKRHSLRWSRIILYLEMVVAKSVEKLPRQGTVWISQLGDGG